jgi:hypothetical protein
MSETEKPTVNHSEEILRWIEAAKTLPPVPAAGEIERRGDLQFLAIEYVHNYTSRRKSWELLDIKGHPLGVTFNEEILPQNTELMDRHESGTPPQNQPP